MPFIAGLMGMALGALPASAIVLGQVDTFQSGSLEGWDHYGVTEVVLSGGPAGISDAYLKTTSSGYPLRFSNTQQWSGDYLTAGVGAISLDLRNFGDSALEIRADIWGDNGGEFTSTQAFSLPADGQWHHVVFGLGPSDLTWVGLKGGNLNATLVRLGALQIRHQPGVPSDIVPAITSSLGIDNVTAVPEPCSLALLAFAGAHLLRRTS